MKNRPYRSQEIPLLLFFLLFFSLSISLLYGVPDLAVTNAENRTTESVLKETKEKKAQNSNKQTFQTMQLPPLPVPPEPRKFTMPSLVDYNPLNTMAPEKAKEVLSFWVVSQGVEKMAEILKGLPAQQVKDIAQLVLEEKSTLSRNDKLEFLYALLTNYPNDDNSKRLILSLIGQMQSLQEGTALLLVAARSDHAKEIPSIIHWAQSYAIKDQKTPDVIAKLVAHALDQVIENDDPDSLAIMFENGVKVTPEQASELLFKAVDGHKKSAFIKLLVDQGADINFHKNGYSLLMKAVEKNNLAMVEEFIKIGGKNLNINAMHDVKIGTALQLALEKSHIDHLLRQAGAREDAHLRSNKIQLRKKD